MESWHLEGCLPLVAPLTCGNDRTLEDHISKYQCICLSLLVIIPHHLSISFLVFAAPIDCVHDYWLQSNGHPHIHIWLSSKRSIFTLIASQATESNRIQSKSILQRSQNQAVAAMQLLGKKHLIQLMLSCCCGKSRFLLHVF